MIRLFPLVVLALAQLACAAGGAEPNEPGDLPHGGTGVFRPLSRAETGVAGSPPGRSIALNPSAFDSGNVSSGHLFYSSAVLEMDAPPGDPDAVTSEVDWTSFVPRRIYRSAPGEQAGFGTGAEVLAADQVWEGEEIFEPWALTRADGTALLFYGTEAGIGLAEAASIEGSFSKVGDGPIVEGAVRPRRPSVVELDGSLLMFFEQDGEIHTARSSDGRTFTRQGPVSLGPAPEDPDTAELSVGGPGATVVLTGAGRQLVRLYFESRRDDGTVQVQLAATVDGVSFERFVRPVVEDADRFAPAPVSVDERVTLLYLTAPREGDDRQLRTLIATVAPRSVSFAPQE